MGNFFWTLKHFGKSWKSLSWSLEVVPKFVQTLYPIYANLINLNLSDVFLSTFNFSKFINNCQNCSSIVGQSPPNSLAIYWLIVNFIMPFTIPTMHEVFHLLFCISSLPPLMSIIMYYNNLLEKGVQV
jgi:hypothetical protein